MKLLYLIMLKSLNPCHFVRKSFDVPDFVKYYALAIYEV